MGSDRFYMRRDYPRPPVTIWTWLVASMIAAFVLQLVLTFSPRFDATASLVDQLRLTVRGVQQWHVWTLLTHAFLHSGDQWLHLAFSLLGLVFIGRELEPQIGPRKFLAAFAGSVVLGAVCWLGLHWRMGGAQIGPGAGLMGLLVILAALYSTQEMNFVPFFLFSVTMRPMYFVYILALIDACMLIFFELPDGSAPLGYAPSAHLGGMLGGWIFFRFLHASNGWDRAATLSWPSWLHGKPRARAHLVADPHTQSSPRPSDLRAEVDRILDKINSEGFGSLTDEEKQVLDDAKDLLSKR